MKVEKENSFTKQHEYESKKNFFLLYIRNIYKVKCLWPN